MKFLNLPRRPPSPKSEPTEFTPTEEIIVDFITKIKSESNNKIRTLESFDVRFFQLKR